LGTQDLSADELHRKDTDDGESSGCRDDWTLSRLVMQPDPDSTATQSTIRGEPHSRMLAPIGHAPVNRPEFAREGSCLPPGIRLGTPPTCRNPATLRLRWLVRHAHSRSRIPGSIPSERRSATADRSRRSFGSIIPAPRSIQSRIIAECLAKRTVDPERIGSLPKLRILEGSGGAKGKTTLSYSPDHSDPDCGFVFNPGHEPVIDIPPEVGGDPGAFGPLPEFHG